MKIQAVLLCGSLALAVLFFVLGIWVPPKAIDFGSDFEILEEASTPSSLPRKILHTPSGVTLIRVPAGSFLMGSPQSEARRSSDEAQHSATIDRDFYLAETETTIGQWKKVMLTDPPVSGGREDLPVGGISWHTAMQFAEKMNAMATDDLQWRWRLPLEKEWEYACRAETDTPFSFGSTITTELANFHGGHPYNGGEKQEFRGGPVPVKSFEPNPWGFYEMHGNLSEWCGDLYVEHPDQADQAKSVDSGASRVIRGGDFFAHGKRARSAYRDGYPPNSEGEKYGFRLVLSIP